MVAPIVWFDSSRAATVRQTGGEWNGAWEATPKVARFRAMELSRPDPYWGRTAGRNGRGRSTFDPNLADEPLSLRFAFTGQGYGSVEQVQVGAHMDAEAMTHEHALSLSLEEGASESFDIEGWTDILEWTVILHLR